MLSEKEAKQITDQIISFSKSDEVHVSITGGTQSHLRFARNMPSTSGTATDTVVNIRSTFKSKSGAVSVNELDADSLRKAVRRSEEIASLAPDDPEFLPGLGPQKYHEVKAYFEGTANIGPEYLAAGAEECIKQAEEKNLVAAGFIQTNAGFSSVGNSKGLFGYTKVTTAGFSETVRTKDGDGSGWVARAANKHEEIDFKHLSKTAVDKAIRSTHPKTLPPGKYVTILEPSCIADLVQSFAFSLDARSADEGRSFFSRPGGGNKIGEQLFPESLNIYSDPADPLAPGMPWASGGLPTKRVDWVKNGTLANLSYSRYWAQKQGKEPLPSPTNVIMKGGTESLEDLIKSTKEGVLVTSFWYIRAVDPRILLLTGLTRDGVFWIENGKIAYPILNFRWNESPVAVLKNIDAMSQAMRVPPRESRSPNIVVPALRVKEFTFSSLSEAV